MADTFSGEDGIDFRTPDLTPPRATKLTATNFSLLEASRQALIVARSMFPTELFAKRQSKDQYLYKERSEPERSEINGAHS